METLNKLNKITTKSAKRVGRGYGSNKGGHTTGRGQKGDTSRGKTKITFEGTKIKKSWIKRLPFVRGKHRLLSRKNVSVFNFFQIESWFKAGQTVDAASLAKHSKTAVKKLGAVKILAKGSITKSINFKGVLLSETARRQILKMGGKID